MTSDGSDALDARSVADAATAGSGVQIIRVAFFHHLPYLIISILYFVMVGQYYSINMIERLFDLVNTFISLMITTLIVWSIYRYWAYISRIKPHRPLVLLLHELGSVFRDRRRRSAFLAVFVSMAIFVETFVKAKARILVESNTHWDRTFTDWDRTLHLGKLPWEWMQPVIGFPLVTFLINLNYNSWILVMWAGFMLYTFVPEHREVRTRFLLSFMMLWVFAGTFFATLWASAGPCYYDALRIAPNPYAGLMSYLREADGVLPLWALDVQQMLWMGHRGVGTDLGISAMPSLHNGTALLLILASGGLPRWARMALTIHAILVFIGSVHLAWHYAVDAYVAWAITLAIWFAAKPLAVWWDGLGISRRYFAMLGDSARGNYAGP